MPSATFPELRRNHGNPTVLNKIIEYHPERKFRIYAYTTEVETQMLLKMDHYVDDEKLKEVFSEFVRLGYIELPENLNIQDVQHVEKQILVLELRGLSVQEEIAIKYTCSSCGVPQEKNVNCCGLWQAPKEFLEDVIFSTETPKIDNLHNFLKNRVQDDIDNLSIPESEKLLHQVRNSISNLHGTTKLQCFSCKNEQKVSLLQDELILDSISEDTLVSIYETTASLVLQGNFSRVDIQKMFPFERSLFLGLVLKKKEEMQ